MSTNARLNDDQRAEACAMREKGLSCERIARVFRARGTPVSAGSIAWTCLISGADLPAHRQRPLCAPPPGRTVKRGSHIVRTFSQEEDAQLLALEAQGLTNSEIGRRLGRAPNTIRGRLATIARRQSRAEQSEGIFA